MLERIRVVLVRPRRGGNVGAVARAMKNMGLDDLVLVAPRTKVGVAAEHMAVHARDVLRRRRTVPDLARALADTTLAVGTVGREEVQNGADPRRLAREILTAAGSGRVALVFGPEDHGLSRADLDLCQRVLTIPTAESYASLNLAQAVLLCAYELRLAALAVDAPGAAPARQRSERGDQALAASGAEREALLTHLGSALQQIGFLSAQNPEHIMRDVRSLFARAGLTKRDVRVWRGVARQVLWAAGPRRKRRSA